MHQLMEIVSKSSPYPRPGDTIETLAQGVFLKISCHEAEGEKSDIIIILHLFMIAYQHDKRQYRTGQCSVCIIMFNKTVF